MFKASSKNNFAPQTSIVGYLPLKKFHILPVFGLEPELIKQSIKSVSRDREEISHCTLLNALVQSLGFQGGFSGYSNAYEQRLKPFMEDRDLKQYADLIAPRFPCDGASHLKHVRQDISERLFYSNSAIPNKIFTGYNFRYDQYFDDGIGIYNFEIEHFQYGLNQNPYDAKCSENVDLALQNPTLQVQLKRKQPKTRPLIDIVIGGDLFFIQSGFNLLGDQLIQPREKESVFQFYNSNKTALAESLVHCNKKMNLFIQRIEEINQGWIEVLPFNENLIFLKGENGDYDFIFKNQRDEEFEHQIYEPYLKRADVPKFEDEYHFKRWFYFEFKGNRQQQLHQAETEYYCSGANTHNYPGIEELLKRSLYSDYTKTLIDLRSSIELPDYQKIKLENGKVLMVSDLITIEDFNEFSMANRSYVQGRAELFEKNGGLDNLEAVNADEDTTLPVSLTWYDLMTFISWFNRKNKIETRLLTYDEFFEISPFYETIYDHSGLSSYTPPLKKISNGKESFIGQPNEEFEYNCLSFYDENGVKIVGHPPYMEEEAFQKIQLKFDDVEFLEKHGLKYIDSKNFGEWLTDKTYVCCKSLTGFYNYISKPTPALNSTGKYKGRKIGFRLCYELKD
ncbi:TPA: hypothetical protein ACGHB2_002937 [Acinetobacter baumannii]|jgi:hypothetical protein|uniref:Uncharacterized protein n=1 Tax=Acinetobacter baumannii (strain 1295743) TaxID=1310613 RepID=A0A009III9_ACIB9|nr:MULTISPECIES: hypothetical protein [Acinetobacter calcoaceticus/baumannii complex]EXB04464.1 hypothetical protein J512_3138 [Acinetobacter baumannii 1295743]MBK4747583.1 hypothetical protein [Acinetobacter baumannii]MCY0274211.1 hypothetical protein [Acinetobacter baumannii]